MKKALFLAFAVLFAAVACEKESNEGGSNSPDEPVVSPAGSVAIAITDVDYTSFTLTVTPLGEPAYYAYAVFDEDMSSTINANNLYTGGYSSTAKKTETVKWTEANPSLTVTVTGLKSDTAYYVYAVAGNSEGTLGSLSSASATTLKSYDYSVSILYNGYDEDTGLASATVTLGTDVEYARVGVVIGNDVDAALAALEAGTIDYQQVTESGRVSVQITETNDYLFVVAAYGNDEVQGTASASFYVNINATWDTIGYATYYDEFFSLNGYSVELQQSSAYSYNYRLVDPYSTLLEGDGFKISETPDKYLYFSLMSVGGTLGDVQITQKDLVYFDACSTGYEYSTTYGGLEYKGILTLAHPAVMGTSTSGTDFGSESMWLHNKVLEYQSDGTTPAVIQLAPAYVLGNSGLFMDYTQYDNLVYICFPNNDIWKSLGTGMYGEDYIGSLVYYEEEGDLVCDYEVEIMENRYESGSYRIPKLYKNYPYINAFSNVEYDETGTYDFYIDTSYPDQVYIWQQDSGVVFAPGSGNTYISGNMYLLSEWYWYWYYYGQNNSAYFGKFENGIITFPNSALMSAFLPGDGYIHGYYANYYDGFYIALPGYAKTSVNAKPSSLDKKVDWPGKYNVVPFGSMKFERVPEKAIRDSKNPTQMRSSSIENVVFNCQY